MKNQTKSGLDAVLKKVKETGSTDQTSHYVLSVFAPELANN